MLLSRRWMAVNDGRRRSNNNEHPMETYSTNRRALNRRWNVILCRKFFAGALNGSTRLLSYNHHHQQRVGWRNWRRKTDKSVQRAFAFERFVRRTQYARLLSSSSLLTGFTFSSIFTFTIARHRRQKCSLILSVSLFLSSSVSSFTEKSHFAVAPLAFERNETFSHFFVAAAFILWHQLLSWTITFYWIRECTRRTAHTQTHCAPQCDANGKMGRKKREKTVQKLFTHFSAYTK